MQRWPRWRNLIPTANSCSATLASPSEEDVYLTKKPEDVAMLANGLTSSVDMLERYPEDMNGRMLGHRIKSSGGRNASKGKRAKT